MSAPSRRRSRRGKARHHERERAPDGRGDCRGGRGARAFDGAGPRAKLPGAARRRPAAGAGHRRNHERRGGDHAALRARIGERAVARAWRGGAGDDRQGRDGLVAVFHSARAPRRADQGRRRQARAGRHLSDRPELRHPRVVAAELSAGDARHDLRPRSFVAGLQHHRLARPARARGQRREHEPGVADVPPRPAGGLSDRRQAQAGSCIFIHVWRSPTTGTAGCVAMPEPRVEALQDFAAGGAVLAILPRGALDRLAGCLPKD